jgi:hypothetical protein
MLSYQLKDCLNFVITCDIVEYSEGLLSNMFTFNHLPRILFPYGSFMYLGILYIILPSLSVYGSIFYPYIFCIMSVSNDITVSFNIDVLSVSSNVILFIGTICCESNTLVTDAIGFTINSNLYGFRYSYFWYGK